MSYIITTNQRFRDIPKGTEAQAYERDGRRMYRFTLDSSFADFTDLSWDYIKDNKKYFNITKPKDDG